jgi:hypothetical protein
MLRVEHALDELGYFVEFGFAAGAGHICTSDDLFGQPESAWV